MSTVIVWIWVCGVPFVGESHGVDGKSTSILQETGFGCFHGWEIFIDLMVRNTCIYLVDKIRDCMFKNAFCLRHKADGWLLQLCGGGACCNVQYVLFDFRHSLLSQSLSFLLGSREGTLWIWTLGRCHIVLISLFKMPFELYFSVPKLCSMLKEPTEPALKNALIEPIHYSNSHYLAGRVN